MNWEQIYEWGLSVITTVQKIKSPFIKDALLIILTHVI